MKKNFLVTMGLLLGLAFTLNAEEQKSTVSKPFNPGWYAGANLGVNTFLAEGNNLITPNHSLNFSLFKNSGFLGRAELGYKFTPIIGLRTFLGYMQANWQDIRSTQNTVGSYPTVKFGSEKLTVDLTINLSNWWSGYNPERKVDISVFAGAGAAYLSSNAATSNFAAIGRGGIQGDYHLSPILDLNLIAEVNIAGDNYNDYEINPLPFDAFSAITFGLTYRLPISKKKTAKTQEVQPTVIEKKEPIVSAATIEQAETKPVEAPVDSTKEDEEPATSKIALNSLNEKIFFALNKADIVNAKQEESLAIISDFLKQHPEATVTISGYADKSTGSVYENNEMSKQRAVNIANTLIRKYGVKIKRIRVMWYGGGVQPFRYAPKNRLVIVKSPFTYTTTVTTALAPPTTIQQPTTTQKSANTIVETKKLSAPTDEKDMFVTVNFIQKKFEIDDAKQEETILKVAEYLKRNPDANIVISGYADKMSGSSKANDELSQKRAESVANNLIKKHSVATDRIQTKWFGSKKQPNTNPTMNRLVLIETVRYDKSEENL